MPPEKKPYLFTRPGRIQLILLFLFGLVFLYSNHLFAATCTETATDAASIQTLIDEAESGDVVCIPAGTYQVNLNLKASITLQGLELARTFLESATETSPIITGATSAIVQNLTIQNGGIGIFAHTISNFTIQNVIISDTTIAVDGDNSTLTVSNVVLNENTTAIISRNTSNLTVRNTVISNNTTDISLTNTTQTFTNNLLYTNQNDNYPTSDTSSVFDESPLFVNSASNDYHLKTGSPAIDAGSGNDQDLSTADIGAYGGNGAEVTPFPVSGLTVTAQGADTVTLAWTANNAYNIAGYKVYFDIDNSGEPYAGTAAEGASPVSLTLLSLQLTSLVIAPVILTAPTGLTTVPGDETLLVSWESVPGATGYQVSYGTTSGSYPTTVDAGSSVIHQITGLTNGVEIFITVTAYFQPTVYLAVAAVDTDDNESPLVNEIAAVLSDDITTGPVSSEVSDFPEESVIFPDLKDEYNCFIATAAYGSSMAPQVVWLRKFRNHFLLTNSPGRRFVAMYYQLSPDAAAFINAHDWLKPVARTGLYPAIGLAWFCLKTGPALKIFSAFFVFGLFMTLKRFSRMKQCG
ncbi:MAG: right-handed parallel beta-helix repeat-containing protein [Proteobacteria bacterium]|nr:right-handed parallel beta-helix repeat-containing protein [Pseudomonadota bacterium]MBU1710627.1 right-handed parallel beta-helix repeat-containing protein [Pseudomonadota bacterium]